MLVHSISAPVTFSTLPEEIILQIFRNTSGPMHERDPSIQHGVNNAWLKELRAKKALLLLCKNTYWPATSHLYEDVVIRRFGQISALARSLRSYPSDRGVAELIKSIRIDSCPVWGPCADVIREDLEYILERCTALRSFSYHPHRGFPLSSRPQADQSEDFFNPTWFFDDSSAELARPLLAGRLSSGLRTLDLAIPIIPSTFPALIRCLANAPSLERLTLTGLTPFTTNVAVWEAETLRDDLELPRLRELNVFYGGPDCYSTYNTHLLSWSTPQLTRLTVYLCADADPLNLIRRVGSQLVYLHVYPIARTMSSLPTPDIHQRILEHVFEFCPLAEHVVVPYPAKDTVEWENIKVKVNSSSLQYLDLWVQLGWDEIPVWFRSPHIRHYITLVHPNSFAPSLLNTRLLITTPHVSLQDPQPLRTSSRDPEWPIVCGPDLVPPGTKWKRFHRFASSSVVQTADVIIPFHILEIHHRKHEYGYSDSWFGDLGSPIEEEVDKVRKYLKKPADQDEHLADDDDNSHHVPPREEGEEGFAESGGLPETTDDGCGESESVGSDDEDWHSDVSDSEAEGEEAAEDVITMDRESMLESFSRSRDREAYHHVAIWDL